MEKEWFGQVMPFSFRYGEAVVTGANLSTQMHFVSREEDNGTCTEVWRHPDGRLALTLRSKTNAAYGAMEYTAYFTNTGTEPSSQLSEVYAADMRFPKEECRGAVLKGILGDLDHQYKPYALKPAGIQFTSTKGRATHIWFPYFNLECKDSNNGWMLAIGWPGTWRASFSTEADGAVHYRAESCLDICAKLLPGETLRTALVTFLPYTRTDADAARGLSLEDAATNAWRQWMVDCNQPTKEPIVLACFNGDTGRPNSDGSISEDSTTWKPTFQKIQEEKLRVDYRWIDAGWYYGPTGQYLDGLSNENEWWRTGSLTLDKTKFPGNSLRECTDYMRTLGTKTLMWFEPERICALDPQTLEDNFGLRRDWLLPVGHWDSYIANLGDPDCYEWTLSHILQVMDENGIDLYREDFNCDPAPAWRFGDEKRTAETGLASAGVTENRQLQGHLRLWDDILAYCARTGKSTFVDSCASGGGRNDLESMRRGIPLLRSDSDRTTIALRLSMSTTFNKWIPIHGTGNGETAGQLDTPHVLDLYEARASYLTVYAHGFAYQDPALPYDVIRQSIDEWEQVSPWFDKEFYVLTDWHTPTQTDGWTAWLYFDPAKENGVLQLFRQETAPNATQVLRLRGLDPKASYHLRDIDGLCPVETVSGERLMQGHVFTMANPRSARIVFVTRV